MGRLTEGALGILSERIVERTKELIAQHPKASDKKIRRIVEKDPVTNALLARNREIIGRKHRGGYPSE